MKKLSKTLCTLTALALLAACNKDTEPGVSGSGEKTNFEITLGDTPETYAVEDPQAAGQITPYYDNVIVYLMDAGGNATGYAWTDAEIQARQKRFEQITQPARAFVYVNTGSVAMPIGQTRQSEFYAKMDEITVADQNKPTKALAAVDAKGNAAGNYLSVQQVTLFGHTSVFTTATSDDGHTLKKAAIKLSSLTGRFEVGTVKPGTGLDALTVEAVYINYFQNNYDGVYGNGQGWSSQKFTELTWPETYTPAWATDGHNAAVNSTSGTKAYAYQVFESDLIPHIVYKVGGTVSAGYKLADGTGDADNPTSFTGKYITVKGFKTVTPLERVDPHRIYKMGLENGGIEITPDKITDKPEKSKIDLVVAITVANWAVSNVTPEI